MLVAQAGMQHANSNSNGAHFAMSLCAAVRPWKKRTGAGPGARRQRRCLRETGSAGLCRCVSGSAGDVNTMPRAHRPSRGTLHPRIPMPIRSQRPYNPIALASSDGALFPRFSSQPLLPQTHAEHSPYLHSQSSPAWHSPRAILITAHRRHRAAHQHQQHHRQQHRYHPPAHRRADEASFVELAHT